jgi:uncharacterized Fe-S cluster protein YjdI
MALLAIFIQAQETMEDITKHYTNDDITVVWKPAQCIHSRICWTNLREVFDPRERPWVRMVGSSTERIVAQVDACPSGALTWYKNEPVDIAPAKTEVDTLVETVVNGPLLVYGHIKVRDKEGLETDKYKVTAFCRCGASANKPYCDGSHNRVGFEG